MIAVHIAKRYAKSLKILASNLYLMSLYKDFSFFLKIIYANKKSVFTLLTNPLLKHCDINNILNITFSTSLDYKFNDIFIDFIKFISKKNRLVFIESIYIQYQDIINEHYNLCNVSIYCNSFIDQHFLNSISEVLKTKTLKTLKIKTFIKTNLLGGIKIKVGNYLLDDSIQGKLKKIQKTIIDINIKE